MPKVITISNRHLNPQEDGLTLIELIIAIAVLSLIIATLFSFYLTGLKTWNRCIDNIEYQQTTRIAINKIIKELQFAHKVKYDVENNAFEAGSPSEIIYFRIYIEGHSTRHSFRLKDSQLLLDRRRDTDNSIRSSNVVALGITGLEFIIDDNETVFVTVKAGNNNREITLKSSVRPRLVP